MNSVLFVAGVLVCTLLAFCDAHRKPCPCEEKCGNKPEFDCHNCKDLKYVANFDPCSYYCICDGKYYYYHESDFTECGKNKYCYQGQCLSEPKDADCSCFGDCYIALKDPYNPCTYKCYDKDGCGIYEVDLPCGTECYNRYCCSCGECKYGDCVVNDCKGRRYGPNYYKDTKSSPKSGGVVPGQSAAQRDVEYATNKKNNAAMEAAHSHCKGR